jgi:hypothetical protein
MPQDNSDSFVRWQVIALEQLTYSINLILSFAVATLGFQASLLSNEKFIPVSFEKCAFALSILAIVLSVISGVYCVINRLKDFRVTKEVARKNEMGKPNIAIQPHRDSAENLGRITWIIFRCQVYTFVLGIILLLIGISGMFIKKLL